MTARSRGLLCVLALSLFAFPPPAGSHPFSVDQEALPPIQAGWSIRFLSPIGQEFVPAASSLDAVELMVGNGDLPGPADLFVNIRHTTIDGPIIGTSLLLTLPFGTGGLTHFDFPSAVPLIPGEVYVIEVVFAGSDTSNPGIAGGYQPPYSQGRAIILGEPDPFDDLWFREGPAMATSGNCSLRACRDEVLAACGSTHRLCMKRCTTLIRSRCMASECTCDSVRGTPGTCICL